MKSEVEKDLPRFAELDAEYEILQELGRGGTAVVYLARERELRRRVAIKVIRSTYIEDEEAAARLAREARTIAALEHPNIVMLHGTRRLRDNSLALIMQYVPGRTLKSEIQSLGALPFDRVERILTDIGNALACAQRHRIVHRDVKPENVYLDDETGIARLSDFGIARPWDADQGLTLPGMAIGTPAYMSPEQIDGDVLDGRSDLYSLGLVGYEMLTGRAPWAGESLFNMIYKQKNEALPSLELIRPGIPRTLLRTLEGALHKDRNDRWADADEFLLALTGRVAVPARAVRVELDTLSSERPSGRRAEPDSKTIQYRRADVLRALPEKPEVAAPVEPRSRVVADIVVAPQRQADIVPYRVLTPDTMADLTEPGTELLPLEGVEVKPRRRRVVAALIAVPLVLVSAALIVKGPRENESATLSIAGAGGAIAAKAAADTMPPAPPAALVDTKPVPALAYAISGDGQAGIAGDTLPQPLSLGVSDATGKPIAGVNVEFAVAEGDGAVVPASAVTDASGVASVRWVLNNIGPHSVVATVQDLEGKTTRFSARAIPRPATRLSAVSPTELQGSTGVPLPSPLAVKVQDDEGNPAANVQIRFAIRSGGGRVTTRATTDEEGVARAEWVLGALGPQEVTATILGVQGPRVSFRANAGPALLPVRRGVSAGGTHTCALGSDGVADCWGANDRGQLGDGSSTRRGSPVRAATPEPLSTIAAGVSHTCGVGVSGAVFCWGGNGSGQLGDNSRSDRAQAVRVTTESPLVSVFAGMAHTCGLDASGRVYCWGENERGQLGDGSRTDRTAPVRSASGRSFRTLALGWAHTCGLTTDGQAFCWGRNTAGELGDGSTADRAEPTPVSGGIRFVAIAAGSAHTCGLTATGRIFCWGQNTYGQLGTGSSANSAVPAEVSPTDSFTALTLGSVHSCALTTDGSARCWGRNTYGQLGDGTTQDRSRPTPVEGNLRFTSLHASSAHTCGSAGGAGYCWGYNLEGQLGNGTRTNQTRPVPVGRSW